MAPGKLIVTGAYAVLQGAPAIVFAVDRHAVADSEAAQTVDVSALQDERGAKLGLGSSSASAVVLVGLRAAMAGDDLRSSAVRSSVFRSARSAHAQSQAGGSGADIAAAVYGGALEYTLDGSGEPTVLAVSVPAQLSWRAFWSGKSVRTSEMVARVRSFDASSEGRTLMQRLHAVASVAAAAIGAGNAATFVDAARDYGRALEALGRGADIPIVPPAFADLARRAESERGAFLPSGAGGGDVAVWLSSEPPSDEFISRAQSLSMHLLSLDIDYDGVRAVSPLAKKASS